MGVEPMKNKAKSGEYRCSVESTVALIGGKWKPIILFHLLSGEKRFGQLKRLIGSVTERMLTHQLRELEGDDLIARKAYAEVPLRVEYRLSDRGKSLIPILELMADWGETHMPPKRTTTR